MSSKQKRISKLKSNIMKRNLLLFVVVFMVFCTDNQLKAQYILTDDDVVVTNGVIESCSYNFAVTDIIIPETLDGQTVKGIADGNPGDGIFYIKGITSVQLPPTLEYIGVNAFLGNELISLTMPNSVTEIGFQSFASNNLESVILSNNLTSIEDWSFYDNSLTDLVIPESVTNIGFVSLASNSLTSIIIPRNIESIEIEAFASNNLTSVFFEENSFIQSIGTNAFASNPGLASITLPTNANPNFAEYQDGNGSTYNPGNNISDFLTSYKALIANTSLIITEARMDRNDHAYIEITNMGSEAVQLNQFELGRVGPWTVPYSPTQGEYMMLPDKILHPGESFTIAAVMEFTEEMYPLYPELFEERMTKKEWWTIADLEVHLLETRTEFAPPGITDSISPKYSTMDAWHGRDCWYLRHHLDENTSVVIDQVGGVFDDYDGTNTDQAHDVAGVTGATGNSTLVRKFSVKTGNTDFANARGVGAEDSEWIVLPHLYQSFEPWRALFWSAGNHGNYTLEETTLVSDVLSVDWENHTITAPWGTRNNDDFMALFEKKEGIAWHYHLSEDPGSLKYNAARTGDRLTVYACGNVLQEMTFDIIVEEPDASANLVIPMFAPQPDGTYSSQINSGNDEVFEVTENMPVMDTITKSIFGIPFATRIDSLLKYLEKAPAAEWEFVWVDGTARPDLKNGDILKVTSENGSERDYFIKVNNYVPGQDASLDAITWPDIPAYYYGIFGWKGDTIPNFESATYNYKVEVPAEVEGIPALTAKTQDVNATVQISRATNLNGTKSQRTYTFTVTAEDGINQRTYSVELEKDVLPEDNQPFHAEPFLSELVFQDQWANGFVEICNPGSELLDLRDYMMVFTAGSPVEAITGASGVDDWSARYIKYVPGYKWVGEVEWAVSPGLLVPDLNVNPIVQADDVFVMGQIDGTAQSGYPWFASEACDVIFDTEYNPWGETYDHSGSAAKQWSNNNFYIFKILNDSIKQGLKPANDPADFELIEVFGYGFESQWVVGGVAAEQITNYLRKPEYIQGNNNLGGSFGTNPEDSEWTWTNRTYWQSQGYNWPQDILMVASDLGKHYFNAPTLHLSTITSPIYKVSKGYSMNETIEGVTTGTTVAEFLGNIIKADDGQTLTVKRGTDGAGISGEDPVSLNDTLVVVSANGTNTTKYILDVSETGLSSDAIITSAIYQVVVDEAGSSVSGFSYGTMLRTVINNITVPDRATLTVINEDDEPVPLKVLNFENTYVNVLATPEIYLEVVAEDNINTIVYQLIPISTASDAFVLSDVFNVNQNDSYIRLIPEGITVAAFFSNLIPSSGAAMKVIDRTGIERTIGTLALDDKLIVTSSDEQTFKEYSLFFGEDVFIQIGLVGTFNDWGNSGPDIPLVCIQQYPALWAIDHTFNESGEVKFRQDEDWAVNWGSSDFPSGVAIQGGPNIPVPAGNYHIFFWSDSGVYGFETINPLIRDSLALVALYNATDGPSWNNNENWLTGPVNTWFGISVENNRVGNISLSENNLIGTLPAEIGLLDSLKNLVLWGNQLSGQIPSEIGNLSRLITLDLGINSFSGTIPAQIGQLLNLEYLFIGSGNQLTGAIPSVLGQLVNLKVLALDENNLLGGIPSDLGNLIQLTHLFLNGNLLWGEVPSAFNQLSHLEVFDLHFNDVEALPDLSNLTSLTNFRCYNNRLTFDDLEPNINIPGFEYIPQAQIGEEQFISRTVGQEFTVASLTGGDNNQYQWFKDGVLLGNQTNSVLEMPAVELADAGSYYCEVTNTVVPGLTLTSRIIHVEVVDPGNYFIDDRDGHIYQWVQIGDQAWMAENLAYLPSVSPPTEGSLTDPLYYVYDYSGTIVAEAKATENYNTYGVLYNWPAAMNGAQSSNTNPSGIQGVCPSGWHLPSNNEWEELINYLGGSEIAGGKMKEEGLLHWGSPNTGATNESGFTGLPGGVRSTNGTWNGTLGYSGIFWSGTEQYSSFPHYPYGRFLSASSSEAITSGYTESYALSIRCIKDEATVPASQQVSSTTLSSDDSDCFNATNTITVAGDGTEVIVESGAMAEFIAGQSILFRPGFHAQAGSDVHAHITEDGQYCMETSPAIVAQQQEEQGQQNEEKAAAVVTGTETAVEVPQTMLVYPNPNSGVFRVKFSQITEETQVMLFNSIGQMIFNQTTTDPEVLIDLPGITSGMYIVKAINRNNQFDQKVIVK